MFYCVGDRVTFGRHNGERTLAQVVSIGSMTITLKSLQQRGTFPPGTLFWVSPAYVRTLD